jgi:universal stress protein E
MQHVKSILVGVDLSEGDRLIGAHLGAPTQEAVDRALIVAKSQQAEVRFACVLDVSADAQAVIAASGGDESPLLVSAREALKRLVVQAEEQGVPASSVAVVGKSWLELIRQAVTDQHDLVVVGTRDLGAVRRVLLGSTAMKLVRNCPCPVWVTKPNQGPLEDVLVAHDLTDVGAKALEYGLSIAKLTGARLHVVHVEPLVLEEVFVMADAPAHCDISRARARQAIEQQIEASGVSIEAKISVLTGEPAFVLVDYLEEHSIDLLIMGTIGRSGIPGVVTGNTAERMLPLVQCSLLAIKPDDFVCPVSLS